MDLSTYLIIGIFALLVVHLLAEYADTRYPNVWESLGIVIGWPLIVYVAIETALRPRT